MGLSLPDRDQNRTHPLTALYYLKGALQRGYCSFTDIYHWLINLTQDNNKSPPNFLFKAIELKEIFLASIRISGRDEQYSTEIIQRKLIRDVGTGLI